MSKAKEPQTIEEFKERLKTARELWVKDQATIKDQLDWIKKLEDTIEAIGDLCNLTAPKGPGPFLQVVKVVDEALLCSFRGHRYLQIIRRLADMFPDGVRQLPADFFELLWDAKELAEDAEIEGTRTSTPQDQEGEAGREEVEGRGQGSQPADTSGSGSGVG